MITIKLPYKSEHTEEIITLQKQYSSVVRYSYNRLMEGYNQINIRQLHKQLNNIDLLDTWFTQCALMEGISIKEQNGDKKIIFGGIKNFKLRIKNKISKETFQLKRLLPINSQGEENKKGNRKFKLDIIDNNQIVFKSNRKKHFTLQLPNLKSNVKKQLFQLEQLNNVKQGVKGYTYSVKLNSTHIFISFEEFKTESVPLNSTRYIGIDMNPNHIGVSVCEFIHNTHQVIHTCQYDVSLLSQKMIDLNVSSSSSKYKNLNNKLKFETTEIAKAISILASHYKCKFVFYEDLNFNGEKKKYRSFNRLIKQIWKRDKFIQNLNKRCSILNVKTFRVNPAYSSIIGNLIYTYSDPINASIEIGRRGYDVIINKNKQFYPSIERVKDLWKEYFTLDSFDWKTLFSEIKNSKVRYRVLLDDVSHKVFRFGSSRSYTLFYNFIYN